MAREELQLALALVLACVAGARGAALRFGAAAVRPAAAVSARARIAASADARPRRLRIAVVGDVHGQWDEGDASALRALRPAVDLCLFVGDFGDEDVVTVDACARSELPGEAVSIFGNHDAWFSLDKRKRRPKKASREYDGKSALEAQRELLASVNLEYARRELPALSLAVVGGRPYSIGGPIWPQFYTEEYGLTSPVESADRIGRIAANAQADALVFLAHNGPAGLGSKRNDICGRDWPHRTGAHAGQSGGDWGDKDLAAAIRMALKAGKRVPLVAFGHLHRRLIGGGLRRMVHYDPSSETVYLNAAEVPRWRGPGVARLGYDAAEAAAEAAAAAAGGVSTAAKVDSVGSPPIERKQHWFAIVEMVDPTATDARAADPPAAESTAAGGRAVPVGAQGGLSADRGSVVGVAEEGDAWRGGARRAEAGGLRVERVSACWVEADGTVAAEEVWYSWQAEGAHGPAGGGSTDAQAASARASAAVRAPGPARGASGSGSGRGRPLNGAARRAQPARTVLPPRQPEVRAHANAGSTETQRRGARGAGLDN